MGVDNRLIMWFIVTILLSHIYHSNIFIKRVNDILLLFSAFIQMITVWSATGLIGLFLIEILLEVIIRIDIKKFSLYKAILLYLFSSAGIILFNMQTMFSGVIENILRKSVDLSKRLEIWTEAIKLIKAKIIFGYGYSNNGAIIYANSGYWYAHNLLLDILIQGGLILLFLYVVLLITVNKKIKRCYDCFTTKACLVAFFVFLVTAITESYLANIQFFLVIGLLYYSREIENGLVMVDL